MYPSSMPHRTANQQFESFFSAYSKENGDNHIKFKPDSLTFRRQLHTSSRSINNQNIYDHNSSMKSIKKIQMINS
jgi:hypothetical protein